MFYITESSDELKGRTRAITLTRRTTSAAAIIAAPIIVRDPAPAFGRYMIAAFELKALKGFVKLCCDLIIYFKYLLGAALPVRF